jgi:hypothetical protein
MFFAVILKYVGLNENLLSLQQVFPNPNAVVFDGLKNAYAVRELGFGGEWTGNVTGVPTMKDVSGDLNPTADLEFRLKWVASVDVRGPIEKYCREGDTVGRPVDALRIINTVLEYSAQV